MKIDYKGFELEAVREDSMGGDELIFYSIFRKSDWWELDSGYSAANILISKFMSELKSTVDDYLANPSDYES